MREGGFGWWGDGGQCCRGRDGVKLTLGSFQELSGSGKGVGKFDKMMFLPS